MTTLETEPTSPAGRSASAAAEDRPAYEGWQSDSVDRSIVRSLRRIIRAVGLYSRELLRRRNLTAPQLATLRQLRRSGPLSAGELARGISVSQATVTGIVDRLEQRNLLTRARDSEDRRRVVIDLTELGYDAVSTSPPPLHERFMLRLDELSAGEREEIDRVLCLIVEMMEAEEVEAAPVLAAEPSLHEVPVDGGSADDGR